MTLAVGEPMAAQEVTLEAARERLRLSLGHEPSLADLAAAVGSDEERLGKVIRILDADLKGKFGIEHPRIYVCGLNPHAGEGGHLGREEIDVITPVDWKNVEWLRRFITENGRILPRRLTGNSQQRQREIARAIKRARHMALLPFGGQSEF